MNRSYYITGPDGSGKTTYINKLRHKFIADGFLVKHLWIRSPKYLSKPLMLLCRIIGLTKYKYINGVRYGEHQFYRSKIISFIFPMIQLFDFKISLFINRLSIKKDDILLIDRYSIDTLADLMVDTRRYNLHEKWVGIEFIKLLNNNINIIALNLDEDTIKKRKLDARYDPNVSVRNKVYKILINDLKLTHLNNNKSIEAVYDNMLENFGL